MNDNIFDNISENDYSNDLNISLLENSENSDIEFKHENFYNIIKDEENSKNNLEECHIIGDFWKNNIQNEITAKSTNFEEKTKELNNKSLNQKNELLRQKRNNSKINIFSDDYLRRRCKNLLFENLFIFINDKINIVNNNNIIQGRLVKKLLPLNQVQKSNGNAEFNKNFLNKSLREIFNENISPKFKKYSPDHNKNIIDLLTDENKNENAGYFKRLFSLKFSECLKHFSGSNNLKDLEGMTTFDSLKSEIRKKEGDDYLETLNYYITNFEVLINKKRVRKAKEKKFLEKKNIE